MRYTRLARVRGICQNTVPTVPKPYGIRILTVPDTVPALYQTVAERQERKKTIMDMRKCDICGKIYQKDILRYEMNMFTYGNRDEDGKLSNRHEGIRFDVCSDCAKDVLKRIGITDEKKKELVTRKDDGFEW
jgi:hypothetical protein